MIRSLYIMSPGGVPVYYYDRIQKEDKVAEAILFTGLITAIKNFMVETDVGEPEVFSTKTREVYLEATDCFSVALIKDVNDNISSEIVKELLSNLTSELYFVLGDDQACNVIDLEQAEMVKDIADLVIPDWEEKIELERKEKEEKD
ncbi:MAG: hypothetical protein H7641_07260 [Candidatus Heimdallarchaeota archaeon]|nr:hypothetical protein [Candidatus Heimdallarchaeota archaeon]MCK4877363.1 hypothetical protein [Candidatus Heimdallarchaeota archaeon]